MTGVDDDTDVSTEWKRGVALCWLLLYDVENGVDVWCELMEEEWICDVFNGVKLCRGVMLVT